MYDLLKVELQLPGTSVYEAYARETMGTAWGIRKKCIPNSELLRLREKYKGGTPTAAVEKKITKRIPRNSE